MRFCASGTSSGGSSTPRSPRATMTASVSSQDRVEVVQRLRLLQLDHHPGAAAAIAPSPPPRPPGVARRTGRCSWRRAPARRPGRRGPSRSARGSAAPCPGTLTPLRSDSGPPTMTSVSSPSARLRVTRSRSLPSSSSSVAPIAAASMISGCGRLTRSALARRRVQVEAELWPVCRCTRPPPNRPTRSLGPCTSARMPIGRPNRSSSSRIMAKRAA